MIEEFKSVKGYEGLYEVSNLGRIKSLSRLSFTGRKLKEKILNPPINNRGYRKLHLSKNGKTKTRQVHQLVAESFLNHIVCGHILVVNHIDFNRTNNNVNNLEIVTQRENSNRKHIKHTSKYTGVHWSKPNRKWKSQININGKMKYLGYFVNELDASLAYEKELNKKTNKKVVY